MTEGNIQYNNVNNIYLLPLTQFLALVQQLLSYSPLQSKAFPLTQLLELAQ